MRIRVILSAVFIVMFALTLVSANEEKSLAISFKLGYDHGSVTNLGTNIIETQNYINTPVNQGNYSLKIFSFLNEELYQTYFDFDLQILSVPPKEWFDDEGNQIYIPNETGTGKLGLEKTAKVIFTPYFKTAKYVLVYKDSKEILNINLSSYAVCNQNKVCDNQETKDTCSEDCSTIVKSHSSSFWQKIMNFFKGIFGMN